MAQNSLFPKLKVQEPSSLPKISANFAITADGKINRSHTESSVFTSSEDLQRLLQLRKSADAILVGRRTLECDQMSLTVPSLPLNQQPVRIIATKSGEIDFSHKVFHTEGGRILIVSEQEVDTSEIPRNVEVVRSPIVEFCRNARNYGIESIHCEGGALLMASLVDRQLLSALFLTLSPKVVFSGNESLSLIGRSMRGSSQKWRLVHCEKNRHDEFFLSYEVAK